MEEALKKAYRAGFDASGEGYNGEYPFRDHGQSPETDKDWVAQRDKEVLEILAEQPAQQEPIGDDWVPCMKLPVVVHVRKQRPGEAHVSTREGITPVKPDDLIMRGVSGEEYPIGRAIFESTYSLDPTPQPPAQRTWVGLTDQERQACINYRAVEAKLREKP